MSKRAQLVSQHLENIASNALEKHQDIIKSYVRGREGIYALYKRDKLYYVGLARNLRNRLKAHLRDRHKHKWDRFSVYLTLGDKHMKELESLALRIVKPTGNAVKGKFAKSEDLKRRFRRDIRLKNNLELDELMGVRAKSVVAPRKKTRVVTGRIPILQEYVSKPMILKARFKGKTVRARVSKAGYITFAGKTYTSPSLAGAAAVKRKTCNGWSFWKFERAPGDWVPLAKLKQ
jgi:hypothetical protein